MAKTEDENKQKSKPVRLNINHIERSRWRRGMAADPNISSSAFRLASVIEDLMNHTSGEAFAGQDELAALSAVSARQVRQHLEALAAAGWIIVLSGRDRTRPRSKRGLHYRPAWPDEETKARCMAREYVSAAEVKSGGKPPVLSERKTGDPASQNRKSSVSKAAGNRRFHSNDRIPTDVGEAAQAASAQGDIISSVDIGGRYKSSPRRAFAYAGPEENDEEIILPSEAGEINIEDMPPLDSPDHEFYNGPERGDLVGIGCGASIPLLAEAEIDAGTPRDPDALTGDRRGDGTFDLSALVHRFVASRIDLSTVDYEPTPQIVLPLAVEASAATGSPIEDVTRIVEEIFYDALRVNEKTAAMSDEELAAYEHVTNF